MAEYKYRDIPYTYYSKGKLYNEYLVLDSDKDLYKRGAARKGFGIVVLKVFAHPDTDYKLMFLQVNKKHHEKFRELVQEVSKEYALIGNDDYDYWWNRVNGIIEN